MIRSSLESKIYILQGTFSGYQLEFESARACPGVRAGGCHVSAGARPGRLRVALISLAVLILLGVLFVRTAGATFDWRLFFDTIQRVSPFWLSIAILLMLLTYVGRALRWEVMLRPLGGKASLARLTSDTAIGFMAATLLGRVGELVRPYLISVSAGVSFSSQLAAWLLERLLDLLAVLLIFGFALTRVPAHGLALGPGLRWTLQTGGYLAAIAGLLCLGLLVAFRNFSEATRARILSALTFLPAQYYERSNKLIDAFSGGAQATRDKSLLGLLVSYTAMEWALIIGAYLALIRSFPATAALKVTDVVALLGFVAFGSIVQIPGIGGGLQITSVVVLREVYGVSLESSSGIALFVWALTLLLIVPLGLACALHQGLSWNKIRQLALKKLPEEQELS